MNRYKVTATRSNGTELSDYFIEATEGAARKTFKECYRNEEYSDVKVELVAEYVQATKEQEREALAKIVKIIEGLGPGSYVGIFKGITHKSEVKKDQLTVSLEFWEYVPQTIQTTSSSSGSSSGGSSGGKTVNQQTTLSSDYQKYLQANRGKSPAVDDASAAEALDKVAQMPY